MKAVVQRVKRASIEINGKKRSEIRTGLLILLGIEEGDTEKDAKILAQKIVYLRIMEDREGKMNLSISDVGGEILVVSQFTLCADVSRGRRPSFIKAAEPNIAKKLYKDFVEEIRIAGLKVQTGKFAAYMNVSLINNGPVTLVLNTKNLN